MGDVCYCKGNYEMFDDYIDFCNYVFGFNGSDKDFKKILPKLYKEEYNPAEKSYIALEDKKIKAVVGAYDNSINICGEVLLCRGIGNVAVHPYARSRGYMKKLMDMATCDMIKDGIDFSALGGRRQRYNYFGYEKSGASYCFSINDDNIRHTFGNERKSRFTYKKVSENDFTDLDNIEILTQKQSYIPIREREHLFEILSSWSAKIYVAYEGSRFVGYCVGDKISEIQLVDDGDFLNFIAGFYDFQKSNSLEVVIPEFKQDYISKLCSFAESYRIDLNKSYNVLNYRNVISATAKLKATYSNIPNGETVILIHGMAGDEKLKITVINKEVIVEHTQADPDIELSHLQAINYLFSPVCPTRNIADGFIKSLLPLPLWLYSADTV